MEPTHKPEDFYSTTPPARIIGTESECNIQIPKNNGFSLASYIGPKACEAAGYQHIGFFLDNGYKLHPDVGHIEISTAESLGPRQAAAADAAGILIINKVVAASGVPHNGIYRSSGTIIGKSENTSGYHENYSIPRSLAYNPLLDSIAASHLASRLWNMNGIVGRGFQLSQKVGGIADPPVTRRMERRTHHGNKPMALIPPAEYDGDTVGSEGWARFEVRFADGGFSRTGRYLSLAAMSLVLRLLEHRDLVKLGRLHHLSFRAPTEAAKTFNNDLTFTTTSETLSGSNITALDYQEELIAACNELVKSVQLPQDELDALDLWQDTVDKLGVSDVPAGDYAGLGNVLDFVPRHRFMSRTFELEAIDSSNPRAVAANLIWDRADPEGGAMKYWAQLPSTHVADAEVQALIHTAPQTRAAIRSNLIRHKEELGVKDIDWAAASLENSSYIAMSDFYNPQT